MDLPTLNGTQQPLPNGIPAKPAVEQNGGHIAGGSNGVTTEGGPSEWLNRQAVMNGIAQDQSDNGTSELAINRLDGLPIEIRQLTQHFRPFHKLVHRMVQQTWNNFSDLIDQLCDITVAPNVAAPNASYAKTQINGAIPGDQSRENLEKKDRLLKFQQDQRALYIKFLVLHDWFKRSRGIDQAIEISMWIHDQRTHFAEAADFIGNMKRELALWQVPNPDLKTAVEILSTGRVSTLSDLGYVPIKPLSSRGMLRTLEDINILLCTRLSLQDQVPLPLSKYRIHDGRVTFIVRHEFELDLSLADEDPSSQFYFIDFRYLFLQRSIFLSGRLYDDFANQVNNVLRTGGLLGCYDFLHDLTLSHKLNSLRREAIDMARKQWSENFRIDLINRTLVVQYWLNRPMTKSWIEIGVKSGRRRTGRDRTRSTEPFLDLRWLPEKKENHDIQVDFNASPISIEKILRSTISQHSSIILAGLYEKLLEYKLYLDGQYLLEFSSSDSEPNDCSLRIQLTHRKHITLSLESISGSLMLQPASSLSGRTEFELNRLQNPVEEGVQRISMLRCLAAEQEVTQRANIAGWEVLQTFRLSQRELRDLFPSNIMRYVLIRQPSWQHNTMVAATFNMEGDNWWLLYPGRQELINASASLVSQHVECSNFQEENEMNHLAFYSQLKEYTSGAIIFKAAEQDLRQKRLRCQLPLLPQFQKDVQLPLMKLQYLPGDVNCVLDSSSSDLNSRNAQRINNDGTEGSKNNDYPTCIQPTVCLRFCGLNKMTHYALILAKGRTTASTNVLESMKSLTSSGFKVNSDAGEFLLSFQIPVGKPFVSELFTRLQNLDSLLSCLTIVKCFESMRIQSLSLTQITIEYNREAELSTLINFPSSASSVAIKLLQAGSNPHSRISHFIGKLLTDLRRPFTVNLGGVLTMLTTTHPLLALFDELEKLRTPTHPAPEKHVTSHSSTIRLHVIARTPTHYALQYFASSTNSRTMIARFEIFRHMRRDTPVWILRAALEETVAYSRSSFMDITLKQKLIDDVFNVRAAPGWLGLDTGASCPLDSPGPLVRKVDDVVRTWAKESLKEMVGDDLRQEQPLTAGVVGEKVTESKAVPNLPENPTLHPQHQQQQQQQQQRPGSGGSRPPAAPNGTTNHNRPAVHTQRPPAPPPLPPPPPPQGQQGPKDVITLD